MEPAGAGIVLDSSVLIAAERRDHTVQKILERIKAVRGEVDVAASVVTIAELMHGAYRSQTQAQRQERLEFIAELSRDVPIHPVTIDVARIAGRIEAEQGLGGIRISFEDLLIGTTALHLGYEVATLNVRDFERIPGLIVVGI